MDPREGLLRIMEDYIRNLPAAEMDRVLNNFPVPRAAQLQEIDEAAENQTKNITDANNGLAAAEAANAGPEVRRAQRPANARKRPLNSFIAFRSFYSILFPDLTQKVKSGLFRFLWREDLFKAKWAILAKAYSTIRDDHGAGVTLDGFLNLNAPFIGIPEPNTYLDAMGWELQHIGEGEYTMSRFKAATILEADIPTNYSANDIVENCYATGYVAADARRINNNQDGNVPVMAFAAQPRLIVHHDDAIQVDNNTIVTDNGNTEDAMNIDPDNGNDDVSIVALSENDAVEFPDTIQHLHNLDNVCLAPIESFEDMFAHDVAFFGDRNDNDNDRIADVPSFNDVAHLFDANPLELQDATTGFNWGLRLAEELEEQFIDSSAGENLGDNLEDPFFPFNTMVFETQSRHDAHDPKVIGPYEFEHAVFEPYLHH